MKSQSFKIDLYPCKEGFNFGSCAIIAIAQYFGLESKVLLLVSKALNIKSPREGLTFKECQKLINFLYKEYNFQKPHPYIPNKLNLTYTELACLYHKNKLIVMFDEHLSYCQYGQVYDSFILNEPYLNIMNCKPTGYWVNY